LRKFAARQKWFRNLLPIGAIVTGTHRPFVDALYSGHFLGIAPAVGAHIPCYGLNRDRARCCARSGPARNSLIFYNGEGIIIEPHWRPAGSTWCSRDCVSWGAGQLFGHSLYIFAKTIRGATFFSAAAGYLNVRCCVTLDTPIPATIAGTLTFMPRRVCHCRNENWRTNPGLLTVDPPIYGLSGWREI